MNDFEQEPSQERVPLFELGDTYITHGAMDVLTRTDETAQELLFRHHTGDWGKLDEHDEKANKIAVEVGNRIASVYPLSTGARVWVITEWDRSKTTILLPDEY